MKCIVLCLFAATSISALASPCTGIDRSLTEERKAILAPIITRQVAQQLNNVESIDVLQSFRYRDWYIIYIDTHVSDEGFLFYKGDPAQNPYLTVWAGAFAADEEKFIFKSLLRGKTKGIPKVLARCFAWHATNDRDQ